MLGVSLCMRNAESQGDGKLRILDINLSTTSSGLEFCLFPKIPTYRIVSFSVWNLYFDSLERLSDTYLQFTDSQDSTQPAYLTPQKLSRRAVWKTAEIGRLAGSRPTIWCLDIKKENSKLLYCNLAQFLMVTLFLLINPSL